MKKPSIKVNRNIWGNWVGFIAGRREYDTGIEFDAVDWLADKLATGAYALSPKSEITEAQVIAHRQALQ